MAGWTIDVECDALLVRDPARLPRDPVLFVGQLVSRQSATGAGLGGLYVCGHRGQGDGACVLPVRLPLPVPRVERRADGRQYLMFG